jgi:hypothetical protein
MQLRRRNRVLQLNRQGFKPSIRRKRYVLQPHDLVSFKGKTWTVKGVFSYGKQVRLSDAKGTIVNTNIKHVQVVKYGKGLLFMFKHNS